MFCYRPISVLHWCFLLLSKLNYKPTRLRDRQELLFLVQQEEDKLGFELPPSFREYIIFSADANDFINHRTVNVIRDDYKVEYLKTRSAISLFRVASEDDNL